MNECRTLQECVTLEESFPTGDKQCLLPLHVVPGSWAGGSVVQLPNPQEPPTGTSDDPHLYLRVPLATLALSQAAGLDVPPGQVEGVSQGQAGGQLAFPQLQSGRDHHLGRGTG